MTPRTWRPSRPWRASPRYATSRAAGRGCGCCGRRARSRTSASSPTRPTPGSAPGCSAMSCGMADCRPTGWPARSPRWPAPEGDIDTLMQRLAGVRVWSYIAARSDWVRDAAHWQGKAREVEDLLSDALHERLTSRFVDRRAAHLMRRLEAGEGEALLSAVTRRGDVVVEGHAVGRVGGFSFFPDPLAEGEERKLVLRAARRALREEMPRRVTRLEAAEDAAFTWDDDQRVSWDGVAVARVRLGPTTPAPDGRRARQRVPRRCPARTGAATCAALRRRAGRRRAVPAVPGGRASAQRPGAARRTSSADRDTRGGTRRHRGDHRAGAAGAVQGFGGARRALCLVPAEPAEAPRADHAGAALGIAALGQATRPARPRTGLDSTAAGLARGLCRGDRLDRGRAGADPARHRRAGQRRARLERAARSGRVAGRGLHRASRCGRTCCPSCSAGSASG